MNSLKIPYTVRIIVTLIIFIPAVIIYSEELPSTGPIAFSTYDKDSNGTISLNEFNAVRSERLKMKAKESRPMRGMGNPTSKNMPAAGSSRPIIDSRQLIQMPENALTLMRKDMQNNLSSLNMIIGYLAANNLDAAADAAETGMGISSMGKHRGSGAAPGRYMSNEMHNIGRNMHRTASDFSKIAKQGDMNKSLKALEKLSASCVACHYSYRTR